MERAKKVLDNKQRHPITMEHQRGGDLYFKLDKDACMSSNLKALHIFLFVTGISSKKSSKIKKEKKIIELIITENHGYDPRMGRR